MGGCRCSYKNCLRATKNSVKDFHFFHYPVKDTERCLKWIANARKPAFFDLPDDQLRNKVICQNHFEFHYFTNATRKRLIHSAVPTLDMECYEPTEEKMNVQVLQSDADSSVFTVDTNLMNWTEVSDVRSFLIQNGNIIPADFSEEPESVQLQVYNLCDERVINNDCKIEVVNQTYPKSDFSINNDNDPLDVNEAVCKSEVIVTNDCENSISTAKKKAECTKPDNGTIVEELPSVLEQYTKEISTLKRTLSARIRKEKLKKHKRKKQIVNKLRTLLPPTLYAAVSLHIFRKKRNFTRDEKHFLTKLYETSPNVYNVLSNDWKLPSSDLVKELIVNDLK